MSSARKRSTINRLKSELDREQQLRMIAQHSADVVKAAADHMGQLAETMQAALLAARAFISAERQCHVQCSTHPVTHQMDADDFEHAEQMTALLAQIDAATGKGESRE